jgi:hypothetical protein
MSNLVFVLFVERMCGRPQLWKGVVYFFPACLPLGLVLVVSVCPSYGIRWVLLAVHTGVSQILWTLWQSTWRWPERVKTCCAIKKIDTVSETCCVDDHESIYIPVRYDCFSFVLIWHSKSSPCFTPVMNIRRWRIIVKWFIFLCYTKLKEEPG